MSNTMSSFDLSVDSSLAEEKHVWTSNRIVIAGLALLTAGLIATKPGLVHYEFPIASLLTGAFLYRRNPVLYVAFTIWLYFLSPLIRQVVDFRSSWMDPNPILLAPLLATCITGWFFLSSINRSWFHKSVRPYAFAILSIASGLLGGLLLNPSKKDVFVS